ncbi:hypothetical protein [Planktotalea sp.]|uniref:hypothetical protein n=1 Tax=Planktotalea sp. TaxID=2029877 RepID=UPI003D6B06AD
MLKRLMSIVTKSVQTLWCHRVIYGGIALAYGGLAFGFVDKESVNQILIGCYVAFVMQNH